MLPPEDKIMWLLSEVDKPQSSFFNCYHRGDLSCWQPGTNEEKKAFAELTSLENREALRKWYYQLHSINPGADVFRRILEKEIGEELPLKA